MNTKIENLIVIRDWLESDFLYQVLAGKLA